MADSSSVRGRTGAPTGTNCGSTLRKINGAFGFNTLVSSP